MNPLHGFAAIGAALALRGLGVSAIDHRERASELIDAIFKGNAEIRKWPTLSCREKDKAGMFAADSWNETSRRLIDKAKRDIDDAKAQGLDVSRVSDKYFSAVSLLVKFENFSRKECSGKARFMDPRKFRR